MVWRFDDGEGRAMLDTLHAGLLGRRRDSSGSGLIPSVWSVVDPSSSLTISILDISSNGT